MNYGKTVDGKLVFAGAMIKSIDREYYNPTDETKTALGYKPMVETATPVKEGFYYTPEWVEEKDRFVQMWKEHEILPPEPDPYIARITALEAEIEALKEAQELQTEKILALDTKIEKKIGIEPVEPPVDPIEKEADK